MSDEFRIETPTSFRQWSLGARALAGGFRGAGGPLWAAANDTFFGYTQEFVHVLSGDLKATGRQEIHLEGSRVVATVEYGSDEVDYAQFEIDRGGEHDFMGRAWLSSQPVFEAVFGTSWNRAIKSWRRL